SMTSNQDAQVVRLCRVLGLEHVLEDARFATDQDRQAHAEAFRALLTGALAQGSAAQWEERLSAAHVPAAKVRTVAEVVAEPHVLQRGVGQQVQDPVSGQTLAVPSIGFKWNRFSLGPDTAPPRLGQ